MVLRKIGRQRLSDAVVEELMRLIERGEWKPGEKLPREAELAFRLGVSRNTLREALYSLTLAGILEQRQGAGTFVRGGPPGRVPCFSLPPRVEGSQGAAALAETRAILEVASARAAAGTSRTAVRNELRRLCAAMGEALRTEDLEAFLRQDAAFHQALAGAAGNPFMAHLLSIVRGLVAPLIIEAVRLRPETLAPYQDDHERLLETVVAGDPRAAAAAMARHMARVREAIGASGKGARLQADAARFLFPELKPSGAGPEPRGGGEKDAICSLCMVRLGRGRRARGMGGASPQLSSPPCPKTVRSGRNRHP